MAEVVIANGPGRAPFGLAASFNRDGRPTTATAIGALNTPPSAPPELQLQAVRFVPFGIRSLIEPPSPVQVNYSGEGPLNDYFPAMTSGPASYPGGVKFYRKATHTWAWTTSSGSDSGEGVVEYVWNPSTLRFDYVPSGTPSDAEIYAQEILHQWLESYFGSNPSATEEQAADAVAGFFQANSSYTATSWTYSLSFGSRTATATFTLSEEDTWAALAARVADFVAGATDAQWASFSGSGDAFFGVENSWSPGVLAQLVQNGSFFRAANPAVMGQQGDRYAFAVRWHHTLPAPLDGASSGTWTHTHQVLEFAGVASHLRRGVNEALRPPPSGSRIYSQPASITRSWSSIDTTTWQLPATRWYDPLGDPTDPADAGWAGRCWFARNFSWATTNPARVLRVRVAALDARAGWTGKIRNFDLDGVAQLFPFTTGAGGVSAAEFILPFAAGGVQWIATPSVIDLLTPEGTAAPAASVRLEYQIRLALARPAAFQGPTGNWFKRRVERRDVASSEAGTFMALGTPVATASAFAERTLECGITAAGAASTVAVASSLGAAVNGATQPMDGALTLWAATRLAVGGDPAASESVVETASSRVATSSGTAVSSSLATGPAVEYFPIGWAGARDLLTPFGLSAGVGWSSGFQTMLQASPTPGPAGATPYTAAMVREARTAPYTATAWRSPSRKLAITDPTKVICLTIGWAVWSA